MQFILQHIKELIYVNKLKSWAECIDLTRVKIVVYCSCFKKSLKKSDRQKVTFFISGEDTSESQIKHCNVRKISLYYFR